MENTKQTHPTLSKHRSWSSDVNRDIEWQKLKHNQRSRFRHLRSKTIDGSTSVTDFDVTDDDVKELKACFDLGFGFDTPLDPKLSQAFPALGFYAAVNRQYNNNRLLSRSLSSDSSLSSSCSASVIIDPSKPIVFSVKNCDDPQKVKAKLKQWAQLVTCSVMESSSQLANNKSVVE